ncbi:endonuclease/exonuclease/phosphatase family protein [Leeuwenhoekiella sp. A16]|uniref:endonuclease/exonuclease/phosphatase family protein n=1 Tax=unclassified Leeuwenhoekiella TaxID=2615029 RepID=UPI003A7FBD90|tara:strand:- start:265562 stop:266584 length:1023 start_codon:yes stop_codon:yes gene_type:complete
MKSLSLFNKIVFVINSFFAFFLLVGYVLPFMPPRIFPPLSVLTLVIPVLIIINLIFVAYWLIQFKKQLLLSGIVLALGLLQNTTLYKFTGTEVKQEKGISLLSYNVRSFNKFQFLKTDSIPAKIKTLILDENPDIVCFQEYLPIVELPADRYPFSFKLPKGKRKTMYQMIYSKYKIIKQESLDFPNSFNNGIYVDIVKDKDTIRVYNLHMQTLSLTPEFSELQHEDSKKLISRVGSAFKKQQEQSEIFLRSEANCPYPKIVAGDFNNTAFSYIYKKIRGEKKDTFEEAGSGFGQTFIFDIIPLRIDFILTDPIFETLGFKNFKQPYSDHYPVKATFRIKS